MLFALLGIVLFFAAPLVVVVLYWRQRKLKLQFDEVITNHGRQNDALHRELLELKRQLASLSQVPAAPSQTVAEKTAARPTPASPLVPEKAPISIEKTILVDKAVPIESPFVPPVHQPTAPEKPVVPAAKTPEPTLSPTPPSVPAVPGIAARDAEARFCVWCGTVHAGGMDKCPTPAPGPRTEERTPVINNKIAGEDQPPVAREPHPPVPERSAEKRVLPPIAAPIKPPAPQAPAAARVAAPPQYASLRAPAAKTPEKRTRSIFAIEETLGRNWLNKLGIALLVIGIASFGIYELGQVGPLGKVLASYGAAVGLLAGGIFLERRERYRILGHTLIGGGWALLFFTTYALYNVAAMRVLSSEVPDLVLMLIVATAMVVHTLRYRSQLVTGLSFLLGYSTVALSHDTVYSLSAGVVLAIGLVGIVLKMGWYELEVFGILSSFLNHLYWLYRILGAGGAQGHDFSDYHASTALLLFYWATFRFSYVVRKIKSSADENMSTIAALLNTLLLLGTMKFQSVHPELAFYALLAIGAIEFSIGQLPITKRRREAFVLVNHRRHGTDGDGDPVPLLRQ